MLVISLKAEKTFAGEVATRFVLFPGNKFRRLFGTYEGLMHILQGAQLAQIRV